MADLLIKTGDMLQVTVPPPAIVPQLAAPVPLTGSALSVLVNTQPVCLQGDELPGPLRSPLDYTAPPFVTPGKGTLTLILLPSNLTLRTSVTGKPALVKGAIFQAIFTVTVPATQPTPGGPVPDPLVVRPCQAQFITTTTDSLMA